MKKGNTESHAEARSSRREPSWQTKPLEEVCNVEYGTRVVQKRDGGKGFPVYGGGGATFEMDGFNREDRLVIARFGMSEECTRFVAGKFYLNDSGLTVSPKNGSVHQRFLDYQMLALNDDIYGLGKGTAQKNLDVPVFRTLPLFVPESLAEQQRIVGLLDEAFEGLATAKANAEKNLQNARALFESHLQSVFTQRGPGWVETTLGEIGKISMCKRIFKEETTANGDIPFYKIGTFGKEPDAFIPRQTYNEYRAKYSFPDKGAVLISAAGTIGRRVRYDGEPAYFQDSNIVWIENNETQALNDYLYHFYGACDWNSTKGATIPRLYNDNLRRISIGFPKSLQEQRRIVARLDALSEETQRLARLYERKHAALEALKKSLLHQAFSGEL